MRKVLGVLVVFSAFCLSGCDHADAKQEADLYCKMVSEGTWPDYKDEYKLTCDGEVAK